MPDMVVGPDHGSPDDRSLVDTPALPDAPHCPLAREARTLLARVAETIRECHLRGVSGFSRLDASQARVIASEELIRRSQALRVQLRNTVTALAHQQRETGVLPERMLILVKSMVDELDPQPLRAADTRALTDAMVRWSIDAYFAA